MSRTSTITLFVIGAFLMISVMGAMGLFLGRTYFALADSGSQITPLPIVTSTVEPTATTAVSPTLTIPFDSTATVAPTVAANATTVPAATVSVVNTSVQYVMALADVNMRSGPGTGYKVIGFVAAGQTAKVTGISSDNGWWRVVCADGSTGSCWVTAQTQYTQQASSPVSQPQPTATNTACTNAATFVADVSIPDGSQVVANTTFIKTWRIQNSGTCTWDGRYFLVHAGGPVLGAVTEMLPLPATVAPGQTVDLSLTMLAPVTPGAYQSDWKIQTPQNSYFGVGRSSSPLWVKINVVSSQPDNATISGLIFQDGNGNGVYDNGEELMANREVWLSSGTACHISSPAVATALSGNDGRYTLKGSFNGNYCLGLSSNGALEDVVSVAVTPGQVLTNINLHAAVPNNSISGYVWNDYCLLIDGGAYTEGNCVPNGTGSFRADGMVQPTESNIPGVTVLLQLSSCFNNNNVAVSSVTDGNGRYSFGNLNPGIYCISINATEGANVAKLLPGDWTFPANGIWYQEIDMRQGGDAYSVNFGWDYQLQ